jgi:hypothetical protein
MTAQVLPCSRCGERPRAFLSRVCGPCFLPEWQEYSDSQQAVWVDLCGAGAAVGIEPGSCQTKVGWERAYCPTHSAAFMAALDQPVSTVLAPKARGKAQPADMSPEAVAARAQASRREAEALAWVAAYTGTWGLPLDLKADRRWGTKYMTLSERQVEVLLAARDRDAAQAQAAQADPAQAEARAFLASISSDEHLADARRGFTFLADMAAQAPGRPFSERQLAAIQNARARRQPVQTGAQVTEIGLYRAADGTVYKVQTARQSGHLYAKRLTVFGQGSATFEFEQGAIRKLRPQDRMTAEDAAAFGHQFGVCAVCGAALTDPESVERGIGPVCATRV